MRLPLFDYNLPKKLIAQCPTRPRDHSRLLVLDHHKATKHHPPSPRLFGGLRRTDKLISHHKFYEIEKYLKKGDVLVLNDSKVIPARLWGRREKTGGKLEILLLRQLTPNTWECLVGGRRAYPGLTLNFSKTLKGQLECQMPVRVSADSFWSGHSRSKTTEAWRSRENACPPKLEERRRGKWKIKFNKRGSSLKKEIYRVGRTPLPPYIKRHASSDSNDYQTIYAKHPGSVAAPTAGFHFTPRLIKKLKKKGVQFEFVTLHVGLGTFAPVKTKKIEEHKMHPEFATLNKATTTHLNRAKREGRRIIAVGTTTARLLESAARKNKTSNNSRNSRVSSISHDINLFITPGYRFKFTDALITNFHLPKSTLLMLVSAFATQPLIMKAYQEAIKKKYRFYSFGDAMMII